MRAGELRGLRLEKRLTQAEVAAKFKVSQAYYSAIERGDKPTEVAAAAQIVSRMRMRTNRTGGGERKAGRQK
jgi:transcriptional regulator with XRE-family HTH domain